jgi:acyl-CoA synthetase (AMP-forming)/AMP-acid ligase II
VIVDADDPYPGCHRLHDIFDLGSERSGVPLPGPRPDEGYDKKSEETAAAFTADGWFRSGDLGVQDGDGHTMFRGRLREQAIKETAP